MLNWRWTWTRVDHAKSPPKNRPRAFQTLQNHGWRLPKSSSARRQDLPKDTPNRNLRPNWGPTCPNMAPTWKPKSPKQSQKHTKIDAGKRSKTTPRKNMFFPQNYATSGIALHWFWTLTWVDYSKNLSFFLGFLHILLRDSAPGSAYRDNPKAVVFSTQIVRFQGPRLPKSIKILPKMLKKSILEGNGV